MLRIIIIIQQRPHYGMKPFKDETDGKSPKREQQVFKYSSVDGLSTALTGMH